MLNQKEKCIYCGSTRDEFGEWMEVITENGQRDDDTTPENHLFILFGGKIPSILWNRRKTRCLVTAQISVAQYHLQHRRVMTGRRPPR
jgi:hypothetical protein